MGEPSRKRVSASLFGTSITEQESALTTLTARYDMSIGTSYLYNTETNGGNYKHVVSEPTDASGLELDRVTMFTAAPVHSRGGTVLLRAARNTHEAGIDSSSRHAVAIHKEQENVLLLGDSSFLRGDRFNVGDNEEFAAYVVEFLISGQRVAGADTDVDEETPDVDGDEDGDGDEDRDGDGDTAVNNTTTPAPVTPEAALSADQSLPTADATTGGARDAGAGALTPQLRTREALDGLVRSPGAV